jgi:hypothetical protein
VIGKHELSDLEDKKLFEKRNGILINKINHLSIVDSSKSRYFYLIYVCKLARLFNSMGVFMPSAHISSADGYLFRYAIANSCKRRWGLTISAILIW